MTRVEHQVLHNYLRDARETLVWKMSGLGEYDMRRPMTPTGTNLLGLVKHSATTHVLYFCEVFARDGGLSIPWRQAGNDPNADFWATADETSEDIVAICRQAWATADATIAELPLQAVGLVPWWGDREVTLHHVLVHVTAEMQRHAGHADIIRELIDHSAGLLEGHDNLPKRDSTWWKDHRDRVESAARQAGHR